MPICTPPKLESGLPVRNIPGFAFEGGIQGARVTAAAATAALPENVLLETLPSCMLLFSNALFNNVQIILRNYVLRQFVLIIS
jgi:hypothetical protein